MFVAVTFASGTTAPVLSVTVPRIVPVNCCATANGAVAEKSEHAKSRVANGLHLIFRSSFPPPQQGGDHSCLARRPAEKYWRYYQTCIVLSRLLSIRNSHTLLLHVRDPVDHPV